ncbi:MAG: cell division protein ZapA [Betaproteobacteria bacterium]|nr:cell division protein ZapA [Betaproteobacteria bacterium]
MKQVEVTILGQSYLLACPDDGQEALLQAVATVDREMSAIRDAGKVKAPQVFISLNRCSLEPGLGTSSGWCERLASDEPEAQLTSPT